MPSEEYAKKMDNKDDLAEYRQRFHIPPHGDGESIYLCGNSLGLQPRTVREAMERELHSWEKNGVEGHFKDTRWVSYHEDLGKLMAPIVGALEEEVVIMNTLTVNLHLMMVSFYRPTNTRYKIMIEGSAFPSDQYAMKSQLRFHGYENALIELFPREGEGYLRHEDIVESIVKHGDSLALVMLGGVNYYTGQVFDMEDITRVAHRVGAVVGYDLAHAVGNIPLNLHEWEVDFAVWCTYKYLNSGPGAIAGAFVHQKHLGKDLQRFAGWWGHDKSRRFLMEPNFVPMKTAEAWQLSNAPIFSMTPIRESLKIFNEVGMERLREKSVKLTGYLEFLLDSIDSDQIWISPPSEIRGCQISIHVRADGKKLFDKLTEEGVICDWREPDVIRVAPVPLYNSFMDIYRFYRIMAKNL